jgi:hypothetical protein
LSSTSGAFLGYCAGDADNNYFNLQSNNEDSNTGDKLIYNQNSATVDARCNNWEILYEGDDGNVDYINAGNPITSTWFFGNVDFNSPTYIDLTTGSGGDGAGNYSITGQGEDNGAQRLPLLTVNSSTGEEDAKFLADSYANYRLSLLGATAEESDRQSTIDLLDLYAVAPSSEDALVPGVQERFETAVLLSMQDALHQRDYEFVVTLFERHEASLVSKEALAEATLARSLAAFETGEYDDAHRFLMASMEYDAEADFRPYLRMIELKSGRSYNTRQEASSQQAVNNAVVIREAYPNPVRDLMTVEFSVASRSQVDISVIDLLGRQLLRQNIDAAEGSSRFRLETNKFASGIYLLQVTAKAESGVVNSASKRILIVR